MIIDSARSGYPILSIPYEILRLILKMTLQLIIDSAEGGRIPKIPDNDKAERHN